MASDISGNWSYRSLLNNPDLTIPFNDLAFGAGTINFNVSENGSLDGTLGGNGWSLAVVGNVAGEDVPVVRWQGRGMIGGEEWVYDYKGYIIPNWQHGVDQVDAIVGSVIRTEPHTGGQAEAGFTASFYAVRA